MFFSPKHCLARIKAFFAIPNKSVHSSSYKFSYGYTKF